MAFVEVSILGLEAVHSGRRKAVLIFLVLMLGGVFLFGSGWNLALLQTAPQNPNLAIPIPDSTNHTYSIVFDDAFQARLNDITPIVNFTIPNFHYIILSDIQIDSRAAVRIQLVHEPNYVMHEVELNGTRTEAIVIHGYSNVYRPIPDFWISLQRISEDVEISFQVTCLIGQEWGVSSETPLRLGIIGLGCIGVLFFLVGVVWFRRLIIEYEAYI